MKKRKILTAEERSEMIETMNNDTTIPFAVIAKRYGVCEQTARNICASGNASERDGNKKRKGATRNVAAVIKDMAKKEYEEYIRNKPITENKSSEKSVCEILAHDCTVSGMLTKTKYTIDIDGNVKGEGSHVMLDLIGMQSLDWLIMELIEVKTKYLPMIMQGNK